MLSTVPHATNANASTDNPPEGYRRPPEITFEQTRLVVAIEQGFLCNVQIWGRAFGPKGLNFTAALDKDNQPLNPKLYARALQQSEIYYWLKMVSYRDSSDLSNNFLNPLLYGSVNGRLNEFKFVESFTQVNDLPERHFGLRVFTKAIDLNLEDILNYLLHKYARFLTFYQNGLNMLMYAAERGKLNTVEIVYKSKPDLLETRSSDLHHPQSILVSALKGTRENVIQFIYDKLEASNNAKLLKQEIEAATEFLESCLKTQVRKTKTFSRICKIPFSGSLFFTQEIPSPLTLPLAITTQPLQSASSPTQGLSNLNLATLFEGRSLNNPNPLLTNSNVGGLPPQPPTPSSPTTPCSLSNSLGPSSFNSRTLSPIDLSHQTLVLNSFLIEDSERQKKRIEELIINFDALSRRAKDIEAENELLRAENKRMLTQYTSQTTQPVKDSDPKQTPGSTSSTPYKVVNQD